MKTTQGDEQDRTLKVTQEINRLHELLPKIGDAELSVYGTGSLSIGDFLRAKGYWFNALTEDVLARQFEEELERRKTETQTDRWFKWLKNRSAVAVVVVAVVIVTGIAAFKVALRDLGLPMGSGHDPVKSEATAAPIGSCSGLTNFPTYVSEFFSTSPKNSSFESVKIVFADELAETRKDGGEIEKKCAARQLIEHFIAERREYYAHQEEIVSDDGSHVPAGPMGRISGTLIASCPQNMTPITGSARLTRIKGTCHGPEILESGAQATALQIGGDHSECVLEVKCEYSAGYMAGQLQSEKAVLTNMAR